MPFLTQTASHLLILRRVRIRKYHVKAALAYGGALLMGADAGAALLLILWPHATFALAALESPLSLGGKVGAAASGCAAFFDKIIAAGVAEESAAA
jgi:hypothetical protein